MSRLGAHAGGGEWPDDQDNSEVKHKLYLYQAIPLKSRMKFVNCFGRVNVYSSVYCATSKFRSAVAPPFLGQTRRNVSVYLL